MFNREINDLFIWIADTMNENSESGTLSNNEKMYFSLVKRRCVIAAKYVKTKYLKCKAKQLVYFVKYPICSVRYAIMGVLRNIARYVYRRIYVK